MRKMGLLGCSATTLGLLVGALAAPGAGATSTMTCVSTWTWTFSPALSAVSGQGTVTVASSNGCLVATAFCESVVCTNNILYPYVFTGTYGGGCGHASVVAQGGAFQIVGGNAFAGTGFFDGWHWQASGFLGSDLCDVSSATGTLVAMLLRP